MENTKVICARCGKECKSNGFGTGYGTNSKGVNICYSCCGELDKELLNNLKVGERTNNFYVNISKKQSRVGLQNYTLYTGILTNWPGTFKLSLGGISCGDHNIAGVRYDTTFKFNGKFFHVTVYGNNSEIAYITRLKDRKGAAA